MTVEADWSCSSRMGNASMGEAPRVNELDFEATTGGGKGPENAFRIS